MLRDRDYTLIIDKSGSMALKDQPGGRSRWNVARESAFALAAKCEELDEDGLTLYLFSGRFKRYDGITSSRVDQVWQENEPSGGTDLAGVLRHAFDAYFQRRGTGLGKSETILVVTDGEPDDPRAVIRAVMEASRKVKNGEELGVSFVQVGNDPNARRFLKLLDEELVGSGAPFDICDTVTLDEMETMGLTEVLIGAVSD